MIRAPRDQLEGGLTPDLAELVATENVGEQLPFFKQAIGPVSEIAALTKTHPALIQTIGADDWQLNRCLNCKVTVFACNDIKKLYLINSGCQTTYDEVDKLRTSNLYSPVFRIAMVSVADFVGSTDLNNGKQQQHTGGTRDRIKALEWHMHEAMLAETATVEERIRHYSEQQYALLKMQRLRAEQEFHTLCDVINSVPEIVLGGTTGGDGSGNTSPEQGKALMETPPATPDNTPMSIGNSPPLGAPAGVLKSHQKVPNKAKNISFKSANASSKHSMTTQGYNQVEGSLDSDGIFDLDGMIDQNADQSPNMSDVEESEPQDDFKSQGLGSGVQIPRTYNRQTSASIAKSLPISVPVIGGHFRTTDEDLETLPEDSNVDIAASIKALARSVHGEAIFGDLPRPRRPKFITDI